MTKKPDYLKRYADRYRLTRREVGIHYILTRYPDRGGMTFDVYDYSDDLLAACLPPRTACRLLQEHPGVFTVHQDASDGTVLLFEETRLHELADVLNLRRRRKLSPEHKAKLMASNVHTRFKPGSGAAKSTSEATISEGGGQRVGNGSSIDSDAA